MASSKMAIPFSSILSSRVINSSPEEADMHFDSSLSAYSLFGSLMKRRIIGIDRASSVEPIASKMLGFDL